MLCCSQILTFISDSLKRNRFCFACGVKKATKPNCKNGQYKVYGESSIQYENPILNTRTTGHHRSIQLECFTKLMRFAMFSQTAITQWITDHTWIVNYMINPLLLL